MSLFDTEERKLASLYRLSFAKIELDAPLKKQTAPQTVGYGCAVQ